MSVGAAVSGETEGDAGGGHYSAAAARESCRDGGTQAMSVGRRGRLHTRGRHGEGRLRSG